jgi:Skp family chaperone for outer membrane proteins
MSATPKTLQATRLQELYQQWRRWTDQEGEAIRKADWAQVDACQAEKARLQEAIQRVDEELAGKCSTADWAHLQSELRALVEDLMARERRNQSDLSAQRQRAQERESDLQHASRQLRQVHQAYVPGASAHWQSYS